MAIMFVLFVVQFSVAATCLSFTEDEEHELGRSGWLMASNTTIARTEKLFACCGYDMPSNTCAFDCCFKSAECVCNTCDQAITSAIDYGLSLCGSVGMFCSFIQLMAVWLTVRFRNQRDPRSDPSAFL